MLTSCPPCWTRNWAVSVAGRYVPDRNDIVFLDFEPTKGKEIGKYRLALVLSSKLYNEKTGLLMCCPISTSIRGAITEVAIGNLERPSVVASNLVNTLDWRMRKVKKVVEGESGVVDDVILRLLPLLGADRVLEAFE